MGVDPVMKVHADRGHSVHGSNFRSLAELWGRMKKWPQLFRYTWWLLQSSPAYQLELKLVEFGTRRNHQERDGFGSFRPSETGSLIPLFTAVPNAEVNHDLDGCFDARIRQGADW